MITTFDYFGRRDLPTVKVCTLDLKPRYILGDLFDMNFKDVFNGISEFQFKIYEENPHYDDIQPMMVIEVSGHGKYVTTSPRESSNGIERFKTVTCMSYQSSLVKNNTGQIKGTYKLYDRVDLSKTLLGLLMSRLNGVWSIGTVDSSVGDLYRTFDIIDLSIYNFIIREVSESYGCIFEFDYENLVINVKSKDNATYPSDVILSFDNLIKNLEVEPIEDEFCTALTVLGGDDLDIAQVNPLGGNVIYNFSYFLDRKMIEENLANKIVAWDNLVKTQTPIYASKLLELKKLLKERLDLKVIITEKETELKALREQLKVAVNATNATEITRINGLIKAKEEEIKVENTKLTNKENEVKAKNEQLLAINILVSFESNFTQDEIRNINFFIKTQKYQNPYIIRSSTMTDEQVLDSAMELLKEGEKILNRISKVRYTFSMDAVNYLNIPSFSKFIRQTRLGAKFRVDEVLGFEINTNQNFIEPILLQMEYSYEDPTNLRLTFGEKLRLSNDEMEIEELLGGTINTSDTVNGNIGNWNDWKENSQNQVTDFINSALDTSKNQLESSENADIIMGGYGMICRDINPDTKVADPNQMWLTSNQLAFTKDSWDSVSLALGKVKLPNGLWGYGLANEKIESNELERKGLVLC